MKWLLVKNDLVRNKAINSALFLFIMFSVVLAVLSVILAVQTFTSINELYKTAQPSHFLQMHKGEINQDEIDDFMSSYEGITYWQTITMISVYGESLTVVRDEDTFDLSNSRLDIGLVKQNETKDLLLNADHEKVILHEGEVGIPVLLKEMYGMKMGDRIVLNSEDVTKEFVIKEFILDAMMNSTMATSTRILLSDLDFDMLEGQVGENEYLIEVYFTNINEASSFQTSYENAGLPQNGQAVTYTIIFILSALTDITTVFVLLLVSLLLIIVSFICVKYTLMATLEEEISEIGTMKAIGLSFTDIRDLYLYKYRALALGSVISGYIVAFLISRLLTEHISTTFRSTDLSIMTLVSSVFVGFLVFLLINFYCNRLLMKIRKVTVVDALVRGKGFEKDQVDVRDGLYKSKKLSVNWLLGIRELFYNFRNWIIVFAVVLITVLMILIPINLINTLKAPEFITYMGSSLEDILIEVENGENIETNYANVRQVLDNDSAIESFYEYRRVRVQTVDVEGELMNLHIDYGEKSGLELQYLNGRAPIEENEIVISYLNAEKIGKSVGNTILLFYDDKDQEFNISGIYQDVTSGGFTAKSTHNFSDLKVQKYTFSVDLKDHVEAEKKASDWSVILGAGVVVDSMGKFIDHTMGGVVKQLRAVVVAIVIMGGALVMLVTILFLKLRLAKDIKEIAVLKAIGFSEHDIKQQYMLKMGCISVTGILAGIILTNVLGEKIVNSALSIAGLGIKKVELIVNPIITYIICPLLLLMLILVVCWIVLRTINKYNIISIIYK